VLSMTSSRLNFWFRLPGSLLTAAVLIMCFLGTWYFTGSLWAGGVVAVVLVIWGIIGTMVTLD
jgi:hypothetical protein